MILTVTDSFFLPHSREGVSPPRAQGQGHCSVWNLGSAAQNSPPLMPGIPQLVSHAFGKPLPSPQRGITTTVPGLAAPC